MSNINKPISFQKPKNTQTKASNNPFHSNLILNNHKKNKERLKMPSMSQKFDLGSMGQTDSLFDLKSTKSALEFIPPEPENEFNPEKEYKKNKNIKFIEPNEIQENNFNKVDIASNNSSKNKKTPVDEISNNSSSNNKNIQTISPLNSGREMSQLNFRNQKLGNNIYNNKQTNINNNTFNSLPNKNFLLNNSGNKIISNQNLINNSINNVNNSIDKNDNNIKRTNLQNQFMNRNIDMLSMLKRLQFFERLNEIGKERMKLFENEFQKDIFFMKKDFFDNTFIKESNIDKFSPLTLIFHFIFNPETEISQYPFKKCFFESIFQLRGDKNIKINYSPNDLKQVPKYFNNFNYVNNLFNNFNENDLNNFLNEIKQWKKMFSFELQFVHPLQNNIGHNQIEINDLAKVYFVSPNDLIVDYHSYAENFPLSDSFVSISQYNFHCDIKYDKNNGRFSFKTSAIVYNKLQIIKETIIQNLIKKEANGVNSVELLVNTWKPLLNIVREESIKNKIVTDKIFKEYLRKTLNKYSKEKPKINFENEEENLRKKNINNNYLNNNINKNIDINNNMNQNNDILIMNKNNFNAMNKNINEENYENSKFNENINKKDNISFYEQNNFEDNIDKKNNYINNNNIINNKLLEKNNIVNEVNNDNNLLNEEEGQNNLLFYGVLITLFLFIFKTFLSIENGNASSETFFNFLIIIIIGFMLIKNNFIDNDNNNNHNL